MFSELYSTALSKWPVVLRLTVRVEPSTFVVEGLTDLEHEISKTWWGQRDEVLMVTLNWAIAAAYHKAFEGRISVRWEDLDASLVRKKFEADLRRIENGDVPTWSEADRLVVGDYFATER